MLKRPTLKRLEIARLNSVMDCCGPAMRKSSTTLAISSARDPSGLYLAKICGRPGMVLSPAPFIQCSTVSCQSLPDSDSPYTAFFIFYTTPGIEAHPFGGYIKRLRI